MNARKANQQRRSGTSAVRSINSAGNVQASDEHRHANNVCPGCVQAKLEHAVKLTRGSMNFISSGQDQDKWSNSNGIASAFCTEIMDFIGKRMEECKPTLSPERPARAALEAAHLFADVILENQIAMQTTVH